MAFDFREEALRGLVALREVLDHLIGESFTRHAGGHATAPGSFSVDVFEQDARYILQASLPGVKPEDLVIQAQGNLIVIRGKRQLLGDQMDQQWILREHQPVTFFRSITLPGAIDAVAASAQLEFGLLTLELPKVEAVKIIPLSARTEMTIATATAASEHENMESSSAMPAESNADVAAEATDTIPDLEALAPTFQDTPEIATAIDEADAAVAPILAEVEAVSASEDAIAAPVMATVSEDEATAIAATEAALVATEAALAETIVAADAVAAAKEVVTAIQEAEAIVEAVQEAALAAELAEVIGDEPAVLAEVATELAAVEELLIAEEISVEALAEAVAAEATIIEAEAVDEALEAEAEAVEIAEAINAAEADISAQGEEVIATIPEITSEAVAADDTNAAGVAAAEALTEATIIAEELVEEILREVEGELVREIFAEMAEAQREAVADVIAEALLADVLEDAASTTMSEADAISADAEAAPLAVPTKLEEVY